MEERIHSHCRSFLKNFEEDAGLPFHITRSKRHYGNHIDVERKLDFLVLSYDHESTTTVLASEAEKSLEKFEKAIETAVQDCLRFKNNWSRIKIEINVILTCKKKQIQVKGKDGFMTNKTAYALYIAIPRGF